MKNKKKSETVKPAQNKGKSKPKSSKKTKTVKKTVSKSIKKAPKKVNKKTNTRKKRTDSIENSVAIATAAQYAIEPPPEIKLKKAALFFWNIIIDERAHVDWSDLDLAVVARLAKFMANEEDEHNKVEKEGYILQKKKSIMEHGKEKIVILESYTNPRQRSLDMVSSKIIALRRSLSLHTRGKEGEARDVNKRFDENKKQQNDIIDDDDGLLASPTQTMQ